MGSDDKRLQKVNSDTIRLRSRVIFYMTCLGRNTASAARRKFGQVEGLISNSVKKVSGYTNFDRGSWKFDLLLVRPEESRPVSLVGREELKTHHDRGAIGV